MNRSRRVAWFALVALIAIGFGIFASRPTEPKYRGRPLSDWLVVLQQAQGGKPDVEAMEALQQLGTNAIPSLLEMLRQRDSRLKLKLMAWAGRQPLIPIKFEGASVAKWRAVVGFDVLQSAGAPAIPALVGMLNDADTSWPALQCLARIGRPALTPLSQAVANSNVNVRFHAVNLLGGLGRDDPPAVVPALLRALKDDNDNVRRAAAFALGNLAQAPAPVVTALLETLTDSSPLVRSTGIQALGNFGAAAKSAVPALVDAVKSGDGGTAAQVAHALMRIAPDAAVLALLEKLDDTNALIRRATVDLLGELGPPAKSALPRLTVKSVADEDEQVRSAATNAIWKFNRSGPWSMRLK